MLKIHRYVSVDRGVEALLDHAILEGEARFAFGVLIGRLASPNASSGNTNGEEDWQFHLTHALPVAAGKDVVDSNFLRLLNGLLVGGLRVAGLYSIWSTGGAGAAAATELERLCQAAFPALPMVMLEKLEGSHEVKVRLCFFVVVHASEEGTKFCYPPRLVGLCLFDAKLCVIHSIHARLWFCACCRLDCSTANAALQSLLKSSTPLC